MTIREALVAAAAGTLTVLALFDLYAEVLAAGVAYGSAWWVLREQPEAPPVDRPVEDVLRS